MIVDYARIAVVADDERKVLEGPKARPDLPQEALLPGLGPLPAHRRRDRGRHGRLLHPPRAPRPADASGRSSAALRPHADHTSLFRLWVRMLFVAAQAEFYRSHPY
ncbi:MAG: hypothetical protein MZV65_40615 [Chromatiales bacterium]|nr:hypothetical protein [Chromatiales bacterium]